MSGIYIPNIETPNNCYECPFAASSYYAVHEYNRRLEWGCILTRKTLTSTKRNRACPLVPVPPHGRLIDANALKMSLAFAEKTAEWAVPALRAVLMVIDEMPTIIPAEDEHTMEEFMYGQEGNPNDGSM